MANGKLKQPGLWEVLTLTKRDVDRRTFLKMLGALGVTVSAGGVLEACVSAPPPAKPAAEAPKAAAETKKPAAAAAPKSSGPRKGGTLVAGWETDVGALDPMVDINSQTTRACVLLFERLVSADYSSLADTPPTVPQLATSWKLSSDGLSMDMELRKGVKFHDGTPFNAEAAKFNIERVTQTGAEYYSKTGATVNSLAYGSIAGVDILGEHSIRLRFKKFDPNFIESTGARFGTAIVSPESVKKWGKDPKEMALHPVATGPFKFVEQEKGVKVVLEKFTEYWGGEPHLDRIIIRPIPDDVARSVALRNGEVDFVAGIPADAIAQVQADPNFKVELNKVPNLIAIFLNNDAKPFDNRLVRQAVNFAVNREVLANQILKGAATPVTSFLVPGSPGYDPNFKYYNYDPAKAKALLKEAGYPDGFEMNIQAPTVLTGVGNAKAMLEYVQQNLAEVGIRAKFQTFDQGTFVSMFAKKMAPEVGGMLWPSVASAISYVERFYSQGYAPPKGRNLGAYTNPQVEALLQKAKTILDADEREKVYQQADRIGVEDAAVLYLFAQRNVYGYHKKVKGFVPANLGSFSLASIYLEE